MTTQSSKHTDQEFRELAIDHNNLYAAFKQRGEELEELKDTVLKLQQILANVERSLRGE